MIVYIEMILKRYLKGVKYTGIIGNFGSFTK